MINDIFTCCGIYRELNVDKFLFFFFFAYTD